MVREEDSAKLRGGDQLPRIVDYETVVERLKAQGMKALYYNSGTFGFMDEAGTKVVGWIGEEDATLRPAAREVAIRVAAPYAETMARRVREIWEKHGGGDIWFTPGSHWAFELEDGGKEYMPELLRSVGIDPELLRGVNRAPAISFELGEAEMFEGFLLGVLQKGRYTDYGIVWPGQSLVGLVHHHGQIWWRTMEEAWVERLKS
jgi:hypothetical protein